jgi:hypothetical protein
MNVGNTTPRAHLTAGQILSAGLCALGAVCAGLAAATPAIRIGVSDRGSDLPAIGSLLSRIPDVELTASQGAQTGFVAAAVVAALAAALALTRVPAALSTSCTVLAGAFPAVASVRSWQIIDGGPEALASDDTTLLADLTGKALTLLDRTNLITVEPAAGTFLLTGAAISLGLAAILGAVAPRHPR